LRAKISAADFLEKNVGAPTRTLLSLLRLMRRLEFLWRPAGMPQIEFARV
jgi:hypothetical protein